MEAAQTDLAGADRDAPALPLDRWVARFGALAVEGVAIDARVPRRLVRDEPLNTRVRGNLGARLRDLRCVTRAPTCAGCGEVAGCDYARVFEAPAATVAGAHGSHGTHPYWLQGVPALEDVAAGTRFTARVAAVGVARGALPYLDVALRDALARAGAVDLSASRPFRATAAAPVGAARRWRLTTASPLVVRADDARCREECPAAPWLAALARAGVRRLAALASAYLPDAPRARAALPDLRGVALGEGRWVAWSSRRYSQRQGRAVPLAGLVGSAVVEGDALRELGPLLGALAVVGVGKATAQGFGDLRVEPLGG